MSAASSNARFSVSSTQISIRCVFMACTLALVSLATLYVRTLSGQIKDGKGIGKFLREGRLQVPPNQRSYAWREKHIRNLLQDMNEAIEKGDAEYFLGTIVLVRKDADFRQ